MTTSTTIRILFNTAIIQYPIHGDALSGLSPTIFYNLRLHCPDAWTNFGFTPSPNDTDRALSCFKSWAQAILAWSKNAAKMERIRQPSQS